MLSYVQEKTETSMWLRFLGTDWKFIYSFSSNFLATGYWRNELQSFPFHGETSTVTMIR